MALEITALAGGTTPQLSLRPERCRAQGHVLHGADSVVLFGAHGVQWQPPAARVADLLKRPHVSSIQITFETDKAPELHAMPPGGFRLAIVNRRDLDAGRAARAKLKRMFRVVVVGSASSARNDGALRRA